MAHANVIGMENSNPLVRLKTESLQQAVRVWVIYLWHDV
jgi:hypothetical protein